MEINIKNGAVTAKNSPQHTPRCIDVSTHLCGREVESSAHFWSARDKDSERGERAAYVTVNIKADEFSHETPRDEKFTPRATEQDFYLDVEDARALRDALSAALDCAAIK